MGGGGRTKDNLKGKKGNKKGDVCGGQYNIFVANRQYQAIYNVFEYGSSLSGACELNMHVLVNPHQNDQGRKGPCYFQRLNALKCLKCQKI